MSEILQMDQSLLKALPVFLRYGYKKTSLDDIAQEVGVSRQTLYLRYKNKETLFVKAIEASLDYALYQSSTFVGEASQDLLDDLVKMFDVWCGEYVELLQQTPHAAEVIEAANEQAQKFIPQKTADFVALIAKRLKDDAVDEPQKKAQTMYYLCKGVAHVVKTREDFLKELKSSLKIILN